MTIANTTTAASAMKIPMSRPWSWAEPQNTGSLAEAATVLDTGTEDWLGSWSGPPSWNR